jgi:hypothetical protein
MAFEMLALGKMKEFYRCTNFQMLSTNRLRNWHTAYGRTGAGYWDRPTRTGSVLSRN